MIQEKFENGHLWHALTRYRIMAYPLTGTDVRQGATTVAITCNEILYTLNQTEKFRLAIVLVTEEGPSIYRRLSLKNQTGAFLPPTTTSANSSAVPLHETS